jgi:hypothetical protein
MYKDGVASSAIKFIHENWSNASRVERQDTQHEVFPHAPIYFPLKEGKQTTN